MVEELYVAAIGALALVLLIFAVRNSNLKGLCRDLEGKHGDLQSQHALLRKRYAPIIKVDEEAAKRQADLDEMKADYRQKKIRYDDLIRTVAAYDEEIELAEFGFYEPHFDFDSSEKFKEAIRDVKGEQKEMVRYKTAIVCHTEWRVDNNLAKGRTMTNRAIRLTARAFNGECDAAIGKVRWNNVKRLELRIEKAFEAINKANKSLNTEISYEYLQLKLKELRLSHEYQEKKQEERECKAELRRQEREEALLKKEAAEAAKEEVRYQQLLAKAKEQAKTASTKRLEALTQQIAELEGQLEAAHARNERAMSMAQQTKSGYVYIISNIGSFGDEVFKIGMTRRLAPQDRVKELSGAGVPFVYDPHALIYSEDAPAMESALHQAFERRRVNKANMRKEFFRVSIGEVKEQVERLFPEADFIETVEAKDFRQTKSIEERLVGVRAKSDAVNRFPDEL